ncbi:MAG: hypothetical protein Q8Q23_01860 [bacterium]|nr:hypothetical protein [bacterium]
MAEKKIPKETTPNLNTSLTTNPKLNEAGEPRLESKGAVKNTHSEKLWISVSQAAKLFGVDQKTIRRAIKNKQVAYVVENERYNLEFGSLLQWAHQSKKLENKLNIEGVGKFVQKWKDEYKISNSPYNF